MPSMRQCFLDNGTKEEYLKNEYFVNEEDISVYMGFVEFGSFRYLKWNYKDEEQVVKYSFEKDFAIEYSSFLEQALPLCSSQAIIDFLVRKLEMIAVFFIKNVASKKFRFKLAKLLLPDMYNRMLDNPHIFFDRQVSQACQ